MKTVSEIFGLPKVAGDVGIEIEVEGKRLPNNVKHWRRDHDGSLRGEETAEYVMIKPMTLNGAKIALTHLRRAYEANNSVIDDSVRAGIHVHVNMQEMNMIQVYNMIVAYQIIEPALIKVCGEGREGNLFCLRATDAMYIQRALVDVAKNKSWRRLVTDNLRYAALNVKPIGQYGSLEFRALRSTNDFDRVHLFAKMLVNLRNAASQYNSPTDLVASFSEGDARGFLSHLVGEGGAALIRTVPRYKVLMTEGVRNAQLVAHAADWDAYRAPKAPAYFNPFAQAIKVEVGVGGMQW